MIGGGTEDDQLRSFETAVLYASDPARAPSPAMHTAAVGALHSLGRREGAWQLIPRLLVRTSEPLARFYALQQLELVLRSDMFASQPAATKEALRRGIVDWVRTVYAPRVAEGDGSPSRNRLALLLAMFVKADYPSRWPGAMDELAAALLPPEGTPVLSRPGSVHLWLRLLLELDGEVADPRAAALRGEADRAVSAAVKDGIRVDGSLPRVALAWARVLAESSDALAAVPPDRVSVPALPSGEPPSQDEARAHGYPYAPLAGDGLCAPARLAIDTMESLARWTAWADADTLTQPALLSRIARLLGEPRGNVRTHAVACLSALARKGMTGPQRVESVRRTGLVDAVSAVRVIAVDRLGPGPGDGPLPPAPASAAALTARVKAMAAVVASGGGDGSGQTPLAYSHDELDWAHMVCQFVGTLLDRLLEAADCPDVLADATMARAVGEMIGRCARHALALAVTAPASAATELIVGLGALATRAADAGRAAAATASGGAVTLPSAATLPTSGLAADAAARILWKTPALLPAHVAAADAGGSGRVPSASRVEAKAAGLAQSVTAATGFDPLRLAEPLLDAALTMLLLPASHAVIADASGRLHATSEDLRRSAEIAIVRPIAAALPITCLSHIARAVGGDLADLAARGGAAPWPLGERALVALTAWTVGCPRASAEAGRLPAVADAVRAVAASRFWLHPQPLVAEAGFTASCRLVAGLAYTPDAVPNLLAAFVGESGLQSPHRRLAVHAGSRAVKLTKHLCADARVGDALIRPHAPSMLAAIGPALLIPPPSAAGSGMSDDARLSAFELAGVLLGQKWVGEEDRARFTAAAIGPTIASLESGLTALRAGAPDGTPSDVVVSRLPPGMAEAAQRWCATAIGSVTFLAKGLPPVGPATHALLERIVTAAVGALALFPGTVREEVAPSSLYRDPGDTEAASWGSGPTARGASHVDRSPVRDRVRFLLQIMVRQLQERVLPFLAPALPLLFACPTATDMTMLLRLLTSVARRFHGRAAPLLRGAALPALLVRVFDLLPPPTVPASNDHGRDRQSLLVSLFTFLQALASGGPDLVTVLHDSAEARAALPALLKAVIDETTHPTVAGDGPTDASQPIRAAGVRVLSSLVEAWWPEPPRPTEPAGPGVIPALTAPVSGAVAELEPAALSAFQSLVTERALPSLLRLPFLPDFTPGDAKCNETAREVATLQALLLRRAGPTTGGVAGNPFAQLLQGRLLPALGAPPHVAATYASTICARAAAGDWDGVRSLFVDLVQALHGMHKPSA